MSYKHHFESFVDEQTVKVQKKIFKIIDIIENTEKVSEQYFKYINNSKGLYEIRVQQGNQQFRIFSFFDKNRLVILANGFNKKKQKTPRSEIRKAQRIKKEYENEKHQDT
ncbi:MAG: type II toxin-antitoxin system RelE/ParE family toxin [Candidatus Marinimicrobia bacterium]|nr:type II toxin-antitoxin system RelE/ParE family toxin [Candidatus Neomarinimicrobiota bacterium]